jgi:hypothetical protein
MTHIFRIPGSTNSAASSLVPQPATTACHPTLPVPAAHLDVLVPILALVPEVQLQLPVAPRLLALLALLPPVTQQGRVGAGGGAGAACSRLEQAVQPARAQ